MNYLQANVSDLKERVTDESRSFLDRLICEGARRMLRETIQMEVAECIKAHKASRDEAVRRLVAYAMATCPSVRCRPVPVLQEAAHP